MSNTMTKKALVMRGEWLSIELVLVRKSTRQTATKLGDAI
jgi:hypothetical protein